ncbi:MAG: hypothetical protein KKA07_10160, partial [Bacteroidetes bacterium]|nr:hypothetical protein [Bacteroidota bacterium]
YIDFNNDATIDLVLYAGTAGGVGASSVVGAGPGMIKGASRTYQINTSSYGMFWAADVLSSGANITSYYNFWGTAGQEKLVFESNGSWQGQTRKFIGVQFDISGQTHFGWVRLSISNNPEPKLTLYDFAFESTPDAGIMAGDHPPCTNFPDLPSVTGAESNTCLGSQAVLVAAGNLNDATNWEWYEGSCGTTPIGSGDTLWYAPGSLTNIFVRGYGDCITPGSCTMVTVSPDTTKPSVTCPGQTVLNGDQYGRALMPDLTVFTSVLDDCDPSPGASQSIIPGTSLEMGVTTVTMTGIDNLGNSDFCEAKILINPPPPGNALNFDGTSDFVELPQIYTTSNTEATIEAWLSPSSFSTQAVLISSDENGSFRITMNPDSTLTASIVLTGSTTHSVNNPNIKLKPFQWRHAAATWQMGDSLKLYLDGRMIAGVPVPTDLLYDAGPGTFGGIGGVASLPTNMFTGKIDEVRFWTTARTESEISGAMGDTVASNASGIFVYYRFDQTGTETTLYDYSPNQFHRAMNSLDFNSDGIASYALVRPPKPDTSLVHSGDFTLIWSNPTLGDTPSQFHLDMGTDPTFNSLVVNNSPIGTSGSSYFSGLDDGGIYYFRISSFIDAVSGKSQYSETGMVHLQSSMSLSLSKTDPTCYGGDDGTATVSISGGSAPFSYLWSNGGGSATTFVLPAGTASVTVTDKYGNEAFGNIILVDPAQITNDLAAVEICNGDSALIFGNYETLDGIYRDTLTAANGCDSIVSQMLTVYDPAIVNAGPDMATCWNEGISISGSMAGSASTITWSSSGSGSLSSTTALSTDYIPTVTDAGVGTVILTITSDDPTGPCPMVSDNMIIT